VRRSFAFFRRCLVLIATISVSFAQEPTKASDDKIRSTAPPCSNQSRCSIIDYCFSGRDFTATIMEISNGAMGNYRRILLNLKFQNVTNHAIALAYHATSSILTDELGNTYSCCKAGGGPDTSATGIGTNQGGKTDRQFKLDANESALATFEVWGIRNTKDPSKFYHYNLTVDQMDPNDSKSSASQRALMFRDFNEATKFSSE
jgi:hypothetical protein